LTADSAFLGTQIAMLESSDIKMTPALITLGNELISTCSASNNADVLQGCLSAFMNLKLKSAAVTAIAQKSISLPGNIAGALNYLVQENQKYPGSESDIVNKLKKETGTALIPFGRYFALFPSTDSSVSNLIISKCQLEGVTICADLIESIKSFQISENDFNKMIAASNNYISPEGLRSLFLMAAHQTNFTKSMAESLFRKYQFINQLESLTLALRQLLSNSNFLNGVAQSSTALKNLCQTMNSSQSNQKLDCFTALTNSPSAANNFNTIKELALQSIEVRSIANPTEALKFLIQFRKQLNDTDKKRLRDFKDKANTSDTERSLARKAI
jgi:hypothetical protein